MKAILSLFARLLIVGFAVSSVANSNTHQVCDFHGLRIVPLAFAVDGLAFSPPVAQEIGVHWWVLAFLGFVVFVLPHVWSIWAFRKTTELLKNLQARVSWYPNYSSILLRYFRGKTSLDFSFTDLSDVTFPDLRPLPRLTTLNIASTSVTDAVAKRIVQCTELRTLDVSETALSDNFIAQISKLRKLETIVANNTKISNESLPILAAMKAIKKLECRRTQVDTGRLEKENKATPSFTIIAG